MPRIVGLQNKIKLNKLLLSLAPAKRGVNFDIWENIPGNDLKLLFKDKRYPDNPDKTQALPSFSTPQNRGDNYGARVTGYYQVNDKKN